MKNTKNKGADGGQHTLWFHDSNTRDQTLSGNQKKYMQKLTQKDLHCLFLAPASNLPFCFSETKYCMSLSREQVPTRHSFSLPTGIKKTSK